ncbi:MAG: hypothetical protein AAF490_27940 [Chloroflexota bacterium]
MRGIRPFVTIQTAVKKWQILSISYRLAEPPLPPPRSIKQTADDSQGLPGSFVLGEIKPPNKNRLNARATK